MAETNQYYIDKYYNYDEIIDTNFKDIHGQDITSIINPLKIDNRQLASMTDNQYDTPHCSGFAVANLFESIYWKKTGKLKNLNASQIYARAKVLDKNISINGTSINCAIRAAAELCGETNNLQYDGIKLNFSILVETVKFYIHKYDFLLAVFYIHAGWMKCNKTNFTIRNIAEQPVGSHAVILVGYDETGVYIQNSWGVNWGYKGFCVLPWEDFLQSIQQLVWVKF